MTVENPCTFLQSEAHPAEGVRRALDVLASGVEGVYDVAGGELLVTESSSPGMSVDIAGGRVLIQGTEGSFQGVYFAENRGSETVAVPSSDASNPRKDLVVCRVQDSNYSGAANAWSIEVVQGTASATPVAPALPASSVLIATIDVAAAASSILDASITDNRSQMGKPHLIGGADVPVADGGTGASDAATARANLGLALGSDVVAYTAAIAGITDSWTAADRVKFDGVEALADVTDTGNVSAAGALMAADVDTNITSLTLPASTTVSAFAATVLDDTTAAGARSTLGAASDSITDAGGYLTAATVEDALQEIASGQYSRNNVTASGTTETLTLDGAQQVVMNNNCTFTFATPTENGHTFLLKLSGAFTPTWPASVDWAGGSAPTYASVSVYVFTTFDAGVTWYGSQMGSAFA